MNAHLNFLHLEFALVTSQALWACAVLFFWLLRHRRVKVRAYCGPRRSRGPLGAASRLKRHPRAKPDWVLQEVIYLAIGTDSLFGITTLLVVRPACLLKAPKRVPHQIDTWHAPFERYRRSNFQPSRGLLHQSFASPHDPIPV